MFGKFFGREPFEPVSKMVPGAERTGQQKSLEQRRFVGVILGALNANRKAFLRKLNASEAVPDRKAKTIDWVQTAEAGGDRITILADFPNGKEVLVRVSIDFSQEGREIEIALQDSFGAHLDDVYSKSIAATSAVGKVDSDSMDIRRTVESIQNALVAGKNDVFASTRIFRPSAVASEYKTTQAAIHVSAETDTSETPQAPEQRFEDSVNADFPREQAAPIPVETPLSRTEAPVSNLSKSADEKPFEPEKPAISVETAKHIEAFREMTRSDTYQNISLAAKLALEVRNRVGYSDEIIASFEKFLALESELDEGNIETKEKQIGEMEGLFLKLKKRYIMDNPIAWLDFIDAGLSKRGSTAFSLAQNLCRRRGIRQFGVEKLGQELYDFTDGKKYFLERSSGVGSHVYLKRVLKSGYDIEGGEVLRPANIEVELKTT